MSTRKEKVEKARERRKQPAVKAEMVRDAVPAFHPQMVRDNTPIPAVKAEGVREVVPATHPAMVKETTPATHPAMVADYDIPKINPIVGNAVSDGTAPVAKQVIKKAPTPATHPAMVKDEEAPRVKTPAVKADGVKEAVPTPATHPAMAMDYESLPEVQNPLEQKDAQIEQKDAGIDVPTINERIQQSLTQRAATNQTEEEKPPTISDLVAGRLEELREKAETEKTDAQKMQKYYALTDALKSLGKMGGAAIGGAIGGDMLGGAPTVGEYKESRGYLDAFEKAKEANERLRSLDEKEFKLAVEDAERSYNQQLAKIDREYKAAQAQLERDWQITFFDYKTKIEQALAEKNMALAQQYKMELLDEENKYKSEYQKIDNDHEARMKNVSLQIAQVQNDPNKNSTAIRFSDGNSVLIPDHLLEDLKTNLIGSKIGSGENQIRITKDNVIRIIKENPELAYDFLRDFKVAGVPAKIDDNWAADAIKEANGQQANSTATAKPKKDFSANKRKK